MEEERGKVMGASLRDRAGRATHRAAKASRPSGDHPSRGWEPISTAPEGKLVETKIDDGQDERNVQKLTRRGRLWFTATADGVGMYVYYTPTHWRPL